MMASLRKGQTLRNFGVKEQRLEAYFAAHPEYALEARPLMEANTTDARRRKDLIWRELSKTTCLRGEVGSVLIAAWLPGALDIPDRRSSTAE